MKLEVGMYCYNKTNRKLGLGKIISFQSNNNVNIKYKNDIELVSIGNVIASFNIIDLIEEGDYINGHRVIFVNDTFTYASVNVETSGEATCEIIPKNNIKTIVTKEQFEHESYKVEV